MGPGPDSDSVPGSRKGEMDTDPDSDSLTKDRKEWNGQQYLKQFHVSKSWTSLVKKPCRIPTQMEKMGLHAIMIFLKDEQRKGLRKEEQCVKMGSWKRFRVKRFKDRYRTYRFCTPIYFKRWLLSLNSLLECCTLSYIELRPQPPSAPIFLNAQESHIYWVRKRLHLCHAHWKIQFYNRFTYLSLEITLIDFHISFDKKMGFTLQIGNQFISIELLISSGSF